MPILIESFSLVARRRAVDEAYPGGWSALAARFASSRTCTDANLVRLSLDDEMELFTTVRSLALFGLLLEADGEPADVAIVSQRLGADGWWPWLELGCVAGPGGLPVLAARITGCASREVACPEGWQFEGSSTESNGVHRLRIPDRPLRHLRREHRDDVYLDQFTGEEVRLRRSGPPVKLVVETAAGRPKAVVRAEVARAPLEQEVGLMFREALAPDAGMLFTYASERRHSFWMKNTLVPLDMLFLGSDGTIVGIVECARPLTLTSRGVGRPSRDILEVPGGWATSHGVIAGDRARPEAHPEVRS